MQRKALDAVVAVILIGIGGLPILCYPILLVLGVMSYDAGPVSGPHGFMVFLMLVYPLVWAPSTFVASRAIQRGDYARGGNISAIPIFYAVAWCLLVFVSAE